MDVRTRFAPSPTGDLHIGSLRTALYSYALAKHYSGDFVLRIEDTDKKREVEGAREKLEKTLRDFGINWDEHYVQSERVELGQYKKSAEKMVTEGHAFYCQCSAKNAKQEGYSKELRDPCRDKNLGSGAIKLKVPENEILSYEDYVLGKKISWNTSEVSDTTLLKSDGFPTYHLAVVVDDTDMKISHVLRGYDWLPSTPVHLLVYKYLGYELPHIGHLTDILDPDRKGKLSKRSGSVSVESFLNDGFLKEALLNFVMLLGWAPKDNREIFNLNQFVDNFDSKGFQRSNPKFNRDKLLWFNAQYLQIMNEQDLLQRILDFYKDKYPKDKLEKIVPLIKTRIKTLAEFGNLANFFFETPDIDKNMLNENCQEHLQSAKTAIENLSDWNLEKLNEALMAEINSKDYKVGKFFMDLRIAITGNTQTPPINDSIIILGKEETLSRINALL